MDHLRVSEALLARDQAIYQMESVCASNRAKEVVIAQLRYEKENLEAKLISEAPAAEMNAEYYREAETLRKSNTDMATKLETLSLSPEGTPAMTTMASIRDTR